MGCYGSWALKSGNHWVSWIQGCRENGRCSVVKTRANIYLPHTRYLLLGFIFTCKSLLTKKKKFVDISQPYEIGDDNISHEESKAQRF